MPNIQIINHLKRDLSSDVAMQYVGVLIEKKDSKDSDANLKQAVDRELSGKEADPTNALHVFKYSRDRHFVLHDLAIHANKEKRLLNSEIHLFAVEGSDKIFNTYFTQEGDSRPTDYNIRHFFKEILLKNEYAKIEKEENNIDELIKHKVTPTLSSYTSFIKLLNITKKDIERLKLRSEESAREQKRQAAAAPRPMELTDSDEDEETLTTTTLKKAQR